MSKQLTVTAGIDLAITGAEFTETGMKLPPGLQPAAYEEVGRRLGQLRGATQWAIGDWWVYGRHEYGERKAVIDSPGWSGPDYDTCEQYAKVCKRYEQPGTRVPGLSFTHHREVMWLSIDAREKLLRRAAREGLSVAALKDLARLAGGRGARKGKGNGAADASPPAPEQADTAAPDVTYERDETVYPSEEWDESVYAEPDAGANDTKALADNRLVALVERLDIINRQIADDRELVMAWERSAQARARLGRMNRIKDFLGCD